MVDGKYLSDAEYEVTTRIGLDLKTNERNSQLVDISPIDFTYEGETPPKSKKLFAHNIDFTIDESGTPSVKKYDDRKLVSDRIQTHRQRPQRKSEAMWVTVETEDGGVENKG